VGLPSDQWGETVAAFVVLFGPAGRLSDLEDWCAQRLVGYKRPREWHVVEAIPRNALGKIMRHQLTAERGA
jgi:acyl-CoA synthetase (AMP-forming)/AMP-acid ligase II